MIATVQPEHIKLNEKVGIRSQLLNHRTERLEVDLLCLPGPGKTMGSVRFHRPLQLALLSAI